MILIATVTGILVAFFLAVTVVPWLRAQVRDPETAADGPEPFGLDTAWLAIRTADIDAIITILELTGVQRSNWHTGLAMTEDPESGVSTVFITPPVDGWTFVIGLALPHPVGPGFNDRCLPLLLALGKKFSEVQYFYSCAALEVYGWSKFSNGKLRRSFAWGDQGVIWNKGTLTRAEQALNLRVFDKINDAPGRAAEIDENESGYPGDIDVLRMAAAWSIDPGTLGRLPEDPAFGYVGQISRTWQVTRADHRTLIVKPSIGQGVLLQNA